MCRREEMKECVPKKCLHPPIALPILRLLMVVIVTFCFMKELIHDLLPVRKDGRRSHPRDTGKRWKDPINGILEEQPRGNPAGDSA